MWRRARDLPDSRRHYAVYDGRRSLGRLRARLPDACRVLAQCRRRAGYGNRTGAAARDGSFDKRSGQRWFGRQLRPGQFHHLPGMLARSDEYESKTQSPARPYDKAAALKEFEPVEGVLRLAPYIVHTHAKDARGNESWGDVPLGEGWVDWPRYLRLLKEIGYDGYLAIEREAGEDRVEEIARAAEFLKNS